jgi:hypothetical protein
VVMGSTAATTDQKALAFTSVRRPRWGVSTRRNSRTASAMAAWVLTVTPVALRWSGSSAATGARLMSFSRTLVTVLSPPHWNSIDSRAWAALLIERSLGSLPAGIDARTAAAAAILPWLWSRNASTRRSKTAAPCIWGAWRRAAWAPPSAGRLELRHGRERGRPGERGERAQRGQWEQRGE